MFYVSFALEIEHTWTQFVLLWKSDALTVIKSFSQKNFYFTKHKQKYHNTTSAKVYWQKP